MAGDELAIGAGASVQRPIAPSPGCVRGHEDRGAGIELARDIERVKGETLTGSEKKSEAA
jgi:hypothetical protein